MKGLLIEILLAIAPIVVAHLIGLLRERWATA
jgi:hypothetical protein